LNFKLNHDTRIQVMMMITMILVQVVVWTPACARATALYLSDVSVGPGYPRPFKKSLRLILSAFID
jgi:hypothetical protein